MKSWLKQKYRFLKENPQHITAVSTAGLFLATVGLAVATGFLWSSTQNLAETSQAQKEIALAQTKISNSILEIEGFKADYLRPKPTCTWINKNNSVELLISNTGSNAFLIGKISMNATYLVDGYYGFYNRTLTFTTGSHPVIPSESNKRYMVQENKIPINIRGDQTNVQGIVGVRDVWLNVSAGKPQFSSGKYVGQTKCHSMPSVFLEPIT